jgi:CMP-N,N'-diacetyllegionaminic acid synthase
LKILALIPARGGSKRLPNKNIKLLGGKPLIAWSIEIAKKFEAISEVLVSTDSEEIAKISKECGALVPWLRPADLATDTATSVDVALHAMDWYEKEYGNIDGLLLLQPTSPFREVNSINKAIELFENKSSVVSVSPSHSHPAWTMKIVNDKLVPFLDGNGLNTRSQDLEPAFALNGSIYLISPNNLRKNQSFYDFNTVPLVMNSKRESLDIDTLEDFEYVEYLVTQEITRKTILVQC